MPELPEAETIARTLRARLRGKTFARAILVREDILHGDPGSLHDALRDRTIRDVSRQGKRVVIHVGNGTTLVVALGMTGRLTVERVSEPVLPHTHMRVGIKDTELELRFRDPRRFGGLWILNEPQRQWGTGGPPMNPLSDGGRCSSPPPATGPQLAPLGVDPLQVRINAFRSILDRDRRIKALLLDQRVIAGLGNIYTDEALHRAHIHPNTSARSLTPQKSADLLRHIRTVLRTAIRYGGSTFMDYRNADGRPGGFQRKHRVYNREGQPCRTCRAPIIRIQAAGRSTHLCPACQPAPGGE